MINQVGRLEGAPWLRPHFGEFLDWIQLRKPGLDQPIERNPQRHISSFKHGLVQKKHGHPI